MSLLDEQQTDRSQQRNQLLAMVLMGVIIIGWTVFFGPKPAPPQEQPAATDTATDTAPDTAGEAPDTPTPVDLATPEPVSMPAAAPPEGTLGLTGLATPEISDPSADEVRIGDEALDLVFTRIGGRLKQATVLLGKDHVDSIKLVPEQPDVPDTAALLPLGLRFASNRYGAALNAKRWEAETLDGGRGVKFTIEVPGEARITKTFELHDETPHVLDTTVTYANLQDENVLLGLDTKEAAFALTWGPQVTSEDGKKLVRQEIVWHKEEGNVHLRTSKLDPPAAASLYSQRELDSEWAAIKSAYFVVAMKPNFEGGDLWVTGVPEQFTLGAGYPRVEIPAQQQLSESFRIYVGPNQEESLRAAWPSLDSALEFFTMFSIMDSFAKFLLNLLNWFHAHIVANYGFAIILLTIVVRMVVFPLTWKSMLSMKKMQKLAPEMEKLKAELGEDQQELQQKMMELYKERGVNPLGGCLPMLLQMPVFIALYRMLGAAFELRRAPFIGWVTDLSAPDQLITFSNPIPILFFELHGINILPILMAGAMLVSTKIMPQSNAAMSNPQQKMMMNFMPVMFSFICYNMASGLNLYILTSTTLGIAQNFAIQKADIEVDVGKKKQSKKAAQKKPKHFYNAAQAKKRELAKEARRDKKAKKA